MSDLDIDSLLGGSTVPNPEPTKPSVLGKDVGPLATQLSSWSQGCRDVPVDLRRVDFVSDDGGMWLALPGEGPLRRIDFKRDPATPKDPKITHANKQFCKMLGVPHSFFMANRPMMRENLVRTWQSGLETEDKRANCIARVRDGGTVTMIRALVPERAIPPKAYDMIRVVMDTFGSAVRLCFAHGDDRDDLILHARFLFEEKVPVASPVLHMGFDLVFSELGACPMTVDAIVYDPEHDVSYVASYGGEPFFLSKYEGLQSKEIADMFPGLLTRIRAEVQDFAAAITAASDGIYSVRQDCVTITRGKGFTSAMRKAVFHEATQATDLVTKLDLARHVAGVARDFDSLKGLVLERAAGHYINLCFARSLAEPQEGTVDGVQAGNPTEVV